MSECNLTEGDIGGLLEAIDCRCQDDTLGGSKRRRYGEVKQKLLNELSSRRLLALLEDDDPPAPNPEPDRATERSG